MKIITVFSGLFLCAASAAEPSTPEQVEQFERRVRPILISHCYNCHSADTKSAGGLRVDDRNGLLSGGDSGPAVIAGHPEKSLLLQRIGEHDPKRRMPKEGEPLLESEIAELTAWIRDGVAWPREKIPSSLGKAKPLYEKRKATHWAWQPLTEPKPPATQNGAWANSTIDRFILAQLEKKNLAPVTDADRGTLIRRLTYDLTGLPPTPQEIEIFEKDVRPDAYDRLVDRLLQSQRFGERWGRHWLDVARYGESTGPSRNIPYPHAWKYRDYVLDAVNRDVPFNRFIEEQIAGDLLPAASSADRDRLSIATGFLALGPKDVNQRFKNRFLMDNVDEQIDTVTRSIVGLTVSCARCHDHKYDPVPTTDYYALAGIFASTDNAAGVRSKMGGAGLDYYDPEMLVKLASDMPKPDPVALEKVKAELAVAKKEWEAIRGTPEGTALGLDGKPKQRPYRLKYEKLQTELLLLTDPGTHGYAVHGVREGKIIADTEVRIRGEAERLGPSVPRGFLTAFDVPGAPKVNPEHSGRLELAAWLSSPLNPLTPRVAANRVWQHLFGKGIVSTVDNFGITGDVPSHPELLDFLATQFVRDGWSVKKLVRSIVLSRTYRLGSEYPEAYRDIDPENRLLWRHSPRRLDAEEIRDAMLLSAGRLDLQAPSGSVAKDFRMVEMADKGPDSRKVNEYANESTARSVYLPLLRGITPMSLEPFDPVTQTLVTGQRDFTTVPAQALYLLNSNFVRRQALALARQLTGNDNLDDNGRIRRVYELTLGRAPQNHEIGRAKEFLARYQVSYREPAVPAESRLPVARKKVPDTSSVDVDQNDIRLAAEEVAEAPVRPEDAKAAAWMSLIQALFASAEFRFVR